MDRTTPTFTDAEFVELLQALAADLITQDEARHRLEAIRPDWFRSR